MGKKDDGLYQKYIVERTDGKPVGWCFVLQDSDPLAIPALLAYAAAAAEAGYGPLHDDLIRKVGEITGRMPMPDRTPDIDYELLAKAARSTFTFGCPITQEIARAVVAALRGQGFTVVRAKPLRQVVDVAWASVPDRELGVIFDALTELGAPLAAPGAAREECRHENTISDFPHGIRCVDCGRGHLDL